MDPRQLAVKAAKQARKDQAQQTISQQIEDTLGPNNCQALRLVHSDTQDEILGICDSKRCLDCGPRKQMAISLQMNAMGPSAFHGRVEPEWDPETETMRADLTEVDRALEKLKKQKQRQGQDFTYQVTGDAIMGYQVISTVRLWTGQQLTKLSKVKKAILNAYHTASERIRRSQALGRVSLVPPRDRGELGTGPSPWARAEPKVSPISLTPLLQAAASMLDPPDPGLHHAV